ncbi:22975_t:CDS:1, partial [Gigaspora margarita]
INIINMELKQCPNVPQLPGLTVRQLCRMKLFYISGMAYIDDTETLMPMNS